MLYHETIIFWKNKATFAATILNMSKILPIAELQDSPESSYTVEICTWRGEGRISEAMICVAEEGKDCEVEFPVGCLSFMKHN